MNDTYVTYLEQYDPGFVLGLLVLCTQIEDDERAA